MTKEEDISAPALRFEILRAARTGDVIRARRAETDMGGAVWTVPAGPQRRLRASIVSRLDVLREIASFRTHGKADGSLSTGRPGKRLSIVALLMRPHQKGRTNPTTHGFRSMFRDWCAQATNSPREVAEAALAHVLRDRLRRPTSGVVPPRVV
jgi:integrase